LVGVNHTPVIDPKSDLYLYLGGVDK